MLIRPWVKWPTLGSRRRDHSRERITTSNTARAFVRSTPVGRVDNCAVDALVLHHQGLAGRGGEHGRDLTDHAPAALQNAHTQVPIITQTGRLPQGQRRLEARQEPRELRAVLPQRQSDRLEAVLQLIVGTQRNVRLTRAERDQRNAQRVAEKAQHVEELALLAVRAGEQVVKLVDHQNPHTHLLEKIEDDPLASVDRPVRRDRSVERCQDRGIEASDRRTARHLHEEDGDDFAVTVLGRPRGVKPPELLCDHALAVVGRSDQEKVRRSHPTRTVREHVLQPGEDRVGAG